MLSLIGFYLHIIVGSIGCFCRPFPDILVNERYKVDDAAQYFRQYVAASLLANSGFYFDSVIAKLAGATIVASL